MYDMYITQGASSSMDSTEDNKAKASVYAAIRRSDRDRVAAIAKRNGVPMTSVWTWAVDALLAHDSRADGRPKVSSN